LSAIGQEAATRVVIGLVLEGGERPQKGSSAAGIEALAVDIVGVAFLEWFEVPEVRDITIHSSSRPACRGRDRQIGRNLEEERCRILNIYEIGRRKTLES
jgi:hypothetical protein